MDIKHMIHQKNHTDADADPAL